MKKQNKFLQDIFPVPLWMGNFYVKETNDEIVDLVQFFKANIGEAALVGKGWDSQETSSQKQIKDKLGITSFKNCNLAEVKQWDEIKQKIENWSNYAIKDSWDVDLKIHNMWTTIYPEKSYVPEHTHAGYLLSGVYYAKAHEGCGDILFHDPAWVAKTMMLAGNSTFPIGGTREHRSPKTGDLILFPSWLPHSTEPNETNEDRIIVSFNFTFGGGNYQ